MPNPLLSFMRNVSKKPPRHPGIAGVKERDIIYTEPLEEAYEGDNNAWRGTEQHGVKSPQHATAYDTGDTQRDAENAGVVDYAEIPEPVQAIPVEIVNQFARELRDHREYQFPVGANAQQIVGANDKRSRVTIRNIAQTTTPAGTLPPNNFMATMTNVTNDGNGSTVNLSASGWTDLMFTVTMTSVVLGAATNIIVKLQQTTDGVNWIDVPGSDLTFTAAGTQTAFIQGPVSSRIRMAWDVTAGPGTDFDGSGNVIVFPIDLTDTITGNEVFIGRDATLSTFTGCRLDPGQEITLAAETEVYAMCNSAETSLLQIIEEFSVELP